MNILTLIAVSWYALVATQQRNATMKANEINKDTAKRQLRAYIGIEPGYVRDFAPLNATQVQNSITNFGQTPAYNLRSYVDLGVLQYPLPDKSKFPFYPPANTKYESVGSIYPHAPLPGGRKMSHVLSKEDISAVADGTTQRFYAGGIVFYTDIFGDEHCTRFLASFGGDRFRDTVQQVKAGKNPPVPWETYSRFNDSDTNCDNKNDEK